MVIKLKVYGKEFKLGTELEYQTLKSILKKIFREESKELVQNIYKKEFNEEISKDDINISNSSIDKGVFSIKDKYFLVDYDDKFNIRILDSDSFHLVGGYLS